jgi:hypothetical protein
MTRKLIGAALLALLLAPASGASAAALEKADCKRMTLTLRMEPDADWAECYRAHQSEQGERADGITASFEVILADLRTHVLHIEAGKAGHTSYFFKDSLQSQLKEFEEIEDRSDFVEDDEFEDYDLVRFQAQLWKKRTDCVGFLKYTHATYTQGGGAGAGAYVVGYDCWRDGAPDRATVEAFLKSIKW